MPGTVKLRRPWYPRPGEKFGLVWVVVVAVLYLPVSLLVRTRYRHLDRLPQEGPAIVVVNHVSHVDPFLVAKMSIDGGRRPRFLAKDTLFDVVAVGAVMRGMGHIPVRRGTADARQSLVAAVDALHRGGLIVLTLRSVTEVIVDRLRHDVAELRGVAEPVGPLYHWRRPGETPMDAA